MTVTCPCSSTTKCHVNLFVYNNNNNNNSWRRQWLLWQTVIEICRGLLWTGRPSDDRPTCPPPITAERARQNVPSPSSYMSLKQSRSHRSSGSTEQETGSSSVQSANHASGQRVYEDDSWTQRKKVRLFSWHVRYSCWGYRCSCLAVLSVLITRVSEVSLCADNFSAEYSLLCWLS